MQKRILITGITGFAGSHLAETLLEDQNNYLIGTYHTAFTPSDFPYLSSVEMKQCDLSSKTDVESLLEQVKPDEIYHLAGATSPSESIQNPKETIEVNVIGELNLLEGIKKLKLQQTKILLIISSEVYGKIGKEDLPITETTPLKPMNPYAVSKVAQDFLGLQYYLAYEMNIIRVRPFNHIGPRQSSKFVVSSFAKQLAEIEISSQESGEIQVGNVEAIRDFSDVQDIVRGYILLMEKGERGEVYNIGSGNGVKIATILQTLISLITKQVEIVQDPELLRPLDTPEIVCDPSKIRSLGWNPTIPLEQSLKNILDFWRRNV